MSTTAVLEAVQKGDVESLRTILEKDPSGCTARDANGVSAIMHSLYSRRTEVLELLLASNPNLDIYEAIGVGELLAHGADRNLTSDDGTTPAQMAAKGNHDQLVKLLSP